MAMGTTAGTSPMSYRGASRLTAPGRPRTGTASRMVPRFRLGSLDGTGADLPMRCFIASSCEIQSPIVVNYKQKVIIAASLAHVIWDGVVRAGLACGVIVALAEPPTIALLRRLTVLDIPGERSSHSVPTPRGGGAPIAVGLLVAVSLAPGAGDTGLAFAVAGGFFRLLRLLDD